MDCQLCFCRHKATPCFEIALLYHKCGKLFFYEPFVALFIVLIPGILRKLEPWFTGTTFKIVFWRLSIPLLAILAVVAAFGQRLILVAVLNLAVVLLYWLGQREFRRQILEVKSARGSLEGETRGESQPLTGRRYPKAKREKGG